MKEETKQTDVPHAQPPVETAPIQIKRISKSAGGVPAVIEAMMSAIGEMGISRSARTLLSLNQFTGFDCPGCAWPEPDAERSHAEFCENGAKHVADEATLARLTSNFFQKWSVADLSLQSDEWLNKQGRLTEPMVLRENSTH